MKNSFFSFFILHFKALSLRLEKSYVLFILNLLKWIRKDT